MHGFWEFKVHAVTMDLLTVKYPFLYYFYEELRHGRLSFWCHAAAGGVPIIGQVKLGLFYPLNLIYLFINTPAVMLLLLVYIHYSLACFFFYLYAKKIRLSTSAALAGAFLFAFNAFMTVQFSTLCDLNTLIWLPLLLYFLEDGFVCTNNGLRINHRAAVAAGCVLGVQILAGFFVYVYCSLMLVICYGVLLWRRLRDSGLNSCDALRIFSTFMSIFMLFALGIGAVAIIPFWEEFGLLARKDISFGQMYGPSRDSILKMFYGLHHLSLNPRNIIKMFPYEVGVISLLLFLNFIKETVLNKYRSFYRLIIVCSIILILWGASPGHRPLLDCLPIPFFKLIKTLLRFKFLLFFSFAVLAGIEINKILNKLKALDKIFLWNFSSILIPVLVFISLLTWNDYNFPFKEPYVMVYQHEIRPKLISYLEIDRSSLSRTYYDSSNQWISSGINLCSARTLLLPKKYFQFTGVSMERSLALSDDSFADFMGYPNFIDTLGCKYIVLDRNSANVQEVSMNLARSTGIVKIYSDGEFALYVNPHVLPKAKFFTHWMSVNDPQDALNVLKDHHFDAHASVVIENNPGEVPQAHQVDDGVSRVMKYDNNEVVVATNYSSAGILALFDMNYPGWQVYVDGKQGTVINTDFLFRGVFLKAGGHTVRFVYYPLLIILGICTTGITAGVAAVVLLRKNSCREIEIVKQG